MTVKIVDSQVLWYDRAPNMRDICGIVRVQVEHDDMGVVEVETISETLRLTVRPTADAGRIEHRLRRAAHARVMDIYAQDPTAPTNLFVGEWADVDGRDEPLHVFDETLRRRLAAIEKHLSQVA